MALTDLATLTVDKHSMNTHNILVVLNERERRLFLNGTGGLDFRKLCPEDQWLDPDTVGFNWGQVLVNKRPEIIIGAWSMPPLNEELLELCSDLKYICFLCGSIRKKIPRSFIEKGGFVSNWGKTISHSVAECALLLILCCLRQVPKYCHEMHEARAWRLDGPDLTTGGLFDRRVGLHGFGNVARELIKLLEPFNTTIQAWSEPVPKSVFIEANVLQAKSLTALFSDNHIVVELEGLTPESKASVGAEQFEAMMPGAIFVNVGRGAVIKESALSQRLKKGDIYAGLDVFEVEPLPESSPLRGNRNVTLLPHTAGPTPDRYPLCTRMALENLRLYAEGKPLKSPVTIECYDRAT